MVASQAIKRACLLALLTLVVPARSAYALVAGAQRPRGPRSLLRPRFRVEPQEAADATTTAAAATASPADRRGGRGRGDALRSASGDDGDGADAEAKPPVDDLTSKVPRGVCQ